MSIDLITAAWDEVGRRYPGHSEQSAASRGAFIAGARWAATAAAPLIEAAVRAKVAEEIGNKADAIDPPDCDWPEGGMDKAFAADGMRYAARIARAGA